MHKTLGSTPRMPCAAGPCNFITFTRQLCCCCADHPIRFSTVATQPDENTYRLNNSCPLYNVEFIGVGGVWVNVLESGGVSHVATLLALALVQLDCGSRLRAVIGEARVRTCNSREVFDSELKQAC